jgi:hypothetical protein
VANFPILKKDDAKKFNVKYINHTHMQARNLEENKKGAGLVDLDELGIPIVEDLSRIRQGG